MKNVNRNISGDILKIAQYLNFHPLVFSKFPNIAISAWMNWCIIENIGCHHKHITDSHQIIGISTDHKPVQDVTIDNNNASFTLVDYRESSQEGNL